MRKTNPFIAKRSVLVVVEGEGEQKLCLYLKEFTRSSGTRIEVKNAHGGSPDAMIAHAAALCRHADYDEVAVLLDGDVPLTPGGRDEAGRIKAQVIVAQPCLECEVLSLLGESHRGDKKDCLKKCKALALDKSALADRETWRGRLPLETLRSRRRQVPWMDRILSLFGL